MTSDSAPRDREQRAEHQGLTASEVEGEELPRATTSNTPASALQRAGRATVQELVPDVYADMPRELHGLAQSSLLAGLGKLEEDGRAARRGEAWSLTETARNATQG